MAKELEAPLTERETQFIDAVIECGGNLAKVSEITGIHNRYCYTLRKRLAKHVAEAAKEYMAFHSVKAAKYVVDTMDFNEIEMPNPIRLQAANSVLDRAGVIYERPAKEIEDTKPVIKANIFILPEKRFASIESASIEIEHERA